MRAVLLALLFALAAGCASPGSEDGDTPNAGNGDDQVGSNDDGTDASGDAGSDQSSDEASDGTTDDASTDSSTDDSSDPTDPPAEATHEVSIEGFAFVPAQLTIAKDDRVVWTNNDGTIHTATEIGGFDTGDIAPGQTGEFRFEAEGTYQYQCARHASMTGTIEVTFA